MPRTAPYGKWDSIIAPESIVQATITFADLFVDPASNKVYHTELRPEDNARFVVVDTLAARDLIASPFSARTSVQEYGGAAAIAHAGIIYFSNTDNRVYSVKATGEGSPQPVTPENPKHRYANFVVHPKRHDLLVSVLEDHTVDTPQTVVTTLSVINTTRKAVFPLVVGADFYAAPAFNPAGTKIAWQEWYHPDMPWEGSLISVADVLVQEDTIVILNKVRVAGEPLTKSVSYPTWASDTTLVFTSDELNGFQNPFIYSTLTGSTRLAIPESIKEDFGAPAWKLGDFPYAILDDPKGGDGKLAAFTAFRDGRNILYIANLSEGNYIVEIHDFPFSRATLVNSSGDSSIVFKAMNSDGPGGIYSCTFFGASFSPSYQVLKSSAPQSTSGNDAYISPPLPITLFRDGEPLYVVYYGPKNPEYSGSSIPGEKPPCIVNAHGGPTGIEAQVLSWQTLYYTSRGYAWLDVNYGGSSSYGRKYISRLAGKWGIVDVQDCQDAPRLLAAAPHSLIDGSRVAIRGGSAGGFTTLASVSVAPNPGFFKAATSLFGISDLVSLAQFTHKFELRYMDKLLGGTPQEVPEVYAARSPVNHADKIVTPLLASLVVRCTTTDALIQLNVLAQVLQGEDDRIVLPEQAEKIVNTIIERGGADRVKYRLFQGEGHSWRHSETIKEAVELEHEWYDKKLL